MLFYAAMIILVKCALAMSRTKMLLTFTMIHFLKLIGINCVVPAGLNCHYVTSATCDGIFSVDINMKICHYDGMQTINSDQLKKPIFSWCPDIDEQTTNQMIRMAGLPFVFYAAVMPDAHLGMNMPIGGVLACDGVVIPDAVGVDGGCGMCTVRTSLKIEDFSMDARWRYLDRMEAAIPVGFAHNDPKRTRLLQDRFQEKFTYDFVNTNASQAASSPFSDVSIPYFEQLGTLGGGNHMAEVDVDADSYV